MSDSDNDTDDWEAQLKALIQRKDEKAAHERQQAVQFSGQADTFLMQAVRPAFEAVQSIFAQAGHTPRPIDWNMDDRRATLEVTQAGAVELRYTLSVEANAQGAFATAEVTLPDRRIAHARLQHANIAQLTKLDIIHDIIASYGGYA